MATVGDFGRFSQRERRNRFVETSNEVFEEMRRSRVHEGKR